MRTTLTIEDRIAKRLKEIAHRSERSLKEVVNETLRAGLEAEKSRSRPARRYRLETVSLGEVVGGADLDRALRIADAIEEEEIAREMELRK